MSYTTHSSASMTRYPRSIAANTVARTQTRSLLPTRSVCQRDGSPDNPVSDHSRTRSRRRDPRPQPEGRVFLKARRVREGGGQAGDALPFKVVGLPNTARLVLCWRWDKAREYRLGGRMG